MFELRCLYPHTQNTLKYEEKIKRKDIKRKREKLIGSRDGKTLL
jgi:hypothetical protein